jgi:hypothetical protein
VGPDTLWTPHVSLTPSWAENHYAPDLLPRLLPPKPVPFLCCDTTGRRRPNSCRWAIHPSPPHATRMTACPPATLSHCVNCGAPWHPVTTAPCVCSSPRCPPVKFRPRPAPRCSIQASVSCRHIPPLLASRIAVKASCRPAAPVNRCQGRCAATIPTPNTQRQGLTQRLCFLPPC